MEIAIFLKDGNKQLILTPETEGEKEVLEHFKEGEEKATIKLGHFYYCQGGFYTQNSEKNDLIILLEPKTK